FNPNPESNSRPEYNFLSLFERVIRLEEQNKQLEKRVRDLEEKADRKKRKIYVVD
ncbi:6411_t:CDS:1, partial [Racocetra fulgida]